MVYRLILSLLLLNAVAATGAATPQTPFLKEILTGRCYDLVPNECPRLVDAFMGAIEGTLDQDVSFRAYFEAADGLFTVKRDNGLLVVGENKHGSKLPTSLQTLQETTGGALINGLVFCGNDKREQGCPSTSGAQYAFWTRAYEVFARKLEGTVVVAVEDETEDSFVLKSALPNLDPNAVTQVQIHVGSPVSSCQSSSTVADIQKILGAFNVTCLDDPYFLKLQLCSGDENTSESCTYWHGLEKCTDNVLTGSKGEPSTSYSRHRHFSLVLLVLGSVLAAVLSVIFIMQRRSASYESLPSSQKQTVLLQ